MARVIKNEDDESLHFGDRLICSACKRVITSYDRAYENDAVDEYVELMRATSDCCCAKVIAESEACRA